MGRWIVTRDLIDDGKMTGARSGCTSRNVMPEDLPVWFRIFDGDRNLYFEGRMDEASFAPLDDLGAAYGATELKYREPGKPWIIL
jgi:hypothetical protein